MNKFDELAVIDAMENIDDEFIVERVEKMKIKHTKRKIIASIIAASLSIVATVSVSAAIITRGGIRVEMKQDDTPVIEVENKEGADKIEAVYSFSTTPNGFKIVYSHLNESHNMEFYSDDSNNELTFGQYLKKNYHDVELSNTEELKSYIDDEIGQEYLVAKYANDGCTIVWDNGDYVFVVNSTIDFDTTIELCKNVCKKN